MSDKEKVNTIRTLLESFYEKAKYSDFVSDSPVILAAIWTIVRNSGIEKSSVSTCKKCKFYDHGGNGDPPVCTNHKGLSSVHEDSFCSYWTSTGLDG